MATRFEDLLNESTKKPAKSRFEQLSAEMELGVEESPQDLRTKLQTDPVFQVLTPQQKTNYVMERLHGATAPRPPGGIPGERTFGESLHVAGEELGGFLGGMGHLALTAGKAAGREPQAAQEMQQMVTQPELQARSEQAMIAGHPTQAAGYSLARGLPMAGRFAADIGELAPTDPYRAALRLLMPKAVGMAAQATGPPLARGAVSAARGVRAATGPPPVPTGIEPFIAETKRGFLADVARGTTSMPSGAAMMAEAVEKRNPYVVKTAEDLIRAATERTREVPPEIGAHTAETAGPVIQEAIQARLKGTEPLPGGREAPVEPQYPEGVSLTPPVSPQQALPAGPGALVPRGPQALVGRAGEAAIPVESGKLQFGKVTGLKELEGKAHDALDRGATQRNINPAPTATIRAAEPLWNLSEAEQNFVRSQFTPETRNILFKAGAPLQGEYPMLPAEMQEALRTEATGAIPWKAFKGARSEVGRILGNAAKRDALGNANVSALKQIYGAMTEDMRTALAPHPGLSQVFEIANNLTEYKRTLQKPPIGRPLAESTVKKTGALPPSQIIPKLAKAAPEEVAAVRETIGPNVEAQTALKSGIVNHVLDQAKGDYGKALTLLEDQRHTLGQKTFNRVKTEFQQRHMENTMADVLSASKEGELVVGPKFADEWANVRQSMADAGMAPEHIKAIDRFAETVAEHKFSSQLAKTSGQATRGVGAVSEKGAVMGAGASLLTGRPLWAVRMAAFVKAPQMVLKVMLKQGGPEAFRKAITSPSMETVTALEKAAGGPPPPSGVRIRPPWPPQQRPGPPTNVTPPAQPPFGPVGPAPAIPSGPAGGGAVPPSAPPIPRSTSRAIELVSQEPAQPGPPGQQRTTTYGTETRPARPPLREVTRGTVETAPPVAPPAVRTSKPLWEMTRDEIEREHARTSQSQKSTEEALFGTEGANRYNRLHRIANGRDPAKADAAFAEIERMESGLSETQRNQLYGMGETAPSAETTGAYRDALRQIDDSSPEALAESLKYALTKTGGKANPEEMSPSQQVAYATLREGYRLASEKGWNTQELSRSIANKAASRFADPQDAYLMLSPFMKEAPKAKALAPSPAVRPPTQPVTVPGRKVPSYDPARSLENAIRHLGGINPEKIEKSGTAGEWSAIPDRKSFIRKGAKHGPDTIVAELQRLGYNINNENELLQAMQNPAQRKAGTEFGEPTELDQAKAHIDMLERKLQEHENAREAAPEEESAMSFFDRMTEEALPPAPKSSMQDVADQIAELGKKEHQTAEEELINRIVKAPESRVSKREMLGLKKKGRKSKGEPLLGESQKKLPD